MANRADKRRKEKAGKNSRKSSGNSLLSKLGAWWKDFQQSKSPILIFLLKFLAVMIPFYIIFYTAFFQDNILYGWNVLNTHVASFVLNIFGAGTEAINNTLMGGGTAIEIFEGCDGIEPTMLLVAGITAFPASLRSKLRGILFGASFLLAVNFIRIISLYLANVYWPAGFDFLHLEFWQMFFIILAILTWIFWIRKSSPIKPTSNDAALST